MRQFVKQNKSTRQDSVWNESCFLMINWDLGKLWVSTAWTSTFPEVGKWMLYNTTTTLTDTSNAAFPAAPSENWPALLVLMLLQIQCAIHDQTVHFYTPYLHRYSSNVSSSTPLYLFTNHRPFFQELPVIPHSTLSMLSLLHPTSEIPLPKFMQHYFPYYSLCMIMIFPSFQRNQNSYRNAMSIQSS